MQDAFAIVDLNFNNLKLNIEFNDYVQDSAEKKINTWGNAKTQSVASTYEAVRRIHPDWDEELVNQEVNLIRFEQGMSLDNPDNLPGLDELTKTEEEPDDKEDKDKEDKKEKDKTTEDDGGE